jgi:hypothetical protein
LQDNTNTVKKNTKTLIDASNEVDLEVNSEKTQYMLMSCHQNAGQTQNLKTVDRSFENVAKSKYLEMTVTSHNLIHEEIKSRLNSGNSCLHSVQNLFIFLPAS